MSFGAFWNSWCQCINSAPVWTHHSICSFPLSIIPLLCYSQILTRSAFISTNCSEASWTHARLCFLLLITSLAAAGSRPHRLSWGIASNDFVHTIYTELFKKNITLKTNQWNAFTQDDTIQQFVGPHTSAVRVCGHIFAIKSLCVCLFVLLSVCFVCLFVFYPI